MAWNTYYESGSWRKKQFHRTQHQSKRAALRKACELSLKTKGFVAVEKNGTPVAACLRGKQVPF